MTAYKEKYRQNDEVWREKNMNMWESVYIHNTVVYICQRRLIYFYVHIQNHKGSCTISIGPGVWGPHTISIGGSQVGKSTTVDKCKYMSYTYSPGREKERTIFYIFFSLHGEIRVLCLYCIQYIGLNHTFDDIT